MIFDWRAKFGLPDMHFYFVQVSTWYAGGVIPALRGAQESGLQQPHTGMATAMGTSHEAGLFDRLVGWVIEWLTQWIGGMLTREAGRGRGQI